MMKVINLSQSEDREAWLDLRRGKIGGTDVKNIKPLLRGADKTPAGFWDLLAQKLSIAKDGEPEIDRGHRLENEALTLTMSIIDKPLNLDPGMWISDFDKDVSVSPDSAEPVDKPIYCAEAKCLDSKNHLKYSVIDKIARGELPPMLDYNYDENYIGINYVPKEHQHQVIQYFVVNEDLQTLYFTLYDDRIAYENLTHHIITVERKDIEEKILEQKQIEINVLSEIRSLIKELLNGN